MASRQLGKQRKATTTTPHQQIMEQKSVRVIYSNGITLRLNYLITNQSIQYPSASGRNYRLQYTKLNGLLHPIRSVSRQLASVSRLLGSHLAKHK